MVTISAFDFDGTVTNRDTMPLFMRHIMGKWRFYRHLIAMAPSLAMALVGLAQRDRVKERFVGKAIAHIPQRQMATYTSSFAGKYAHIIRPAAMEAINLALSKGHRVVIISASLDLWVKPFFTDPRIAVVATRAEIVDGLYTGRFSTPNCRGSEKLNRLRQLIPQSQWHQLIAYGNSDGDKALLQIADIAHFRPFRS